MGADLLRRCARVPVTVPQDGVPAVAVVHASLWADIIRALGAEVLRDEREREGGDG